MYISLSLIIAYLFTLHIRALVVVPCGGPKKVSPYIHLMLLLFQSSEVVCNHVSIFLSLDTFSILY